MNKMKDKLFVLNEKEYIENIIENPFYMITDKIYQIVVLAAKYYFGVEGKDKKETTKLLKLLLWNKCPKYRDEEQKYKHLIEKVVEKYCHKDTCKLSEINSIPITKTEIDKIKEIDSLPDLNGADRKAMQRLLFVILVFGKWQRMRNAKNEKCWCNLSSGEILTMARVSKSKITLLGKLYNAGYIQHQEALNGDNCYPLIVDDTTEIKLQVKDLREVGYQWNLFRGDAFTTCQKCGITLKTNSAHDGMCKDCFATRQSIIEKCDCCGTLFSRGSRAGIKKRCDNCQSKIQKMEKSKVITKKIMPKVA